MTGPATDTRPVNHTLPAWDLLAGAYAAFTLVAAERARRQDGRGQEIRIPLSDLAIASLGHLGQIGEVQVLGQDRERMGNELYGAFGRDFETLDGKRLMVIAITARQWSGLVAALGLQARISELESELGVRFDRDEGLRFTHRRRLVPLIESAIAGRSAADLGAAFESRAVCWAPYQTLHQAVSTDRYFSNANPILSVIGHPSGQCYLAPGAAASLPSEPRRAAAPAHRLGQDTDEVLAELLALSAGEIGRLHDAGLVAGS
jgi:2-methylfumaryl-CoA isomerase